MKNFIRLTLFSLKLHDIGWSQQQQQEISAVVVVCDTSKHSNSDTHARTRATNTIKSNKKTKRATKPCTKQVTEKPDASSSRGPDE